LTFSHQFFAKKGCFLSFEWLKGNFAAFGPPEKIFLAHPWKIHYWPLPGNIPPAPMFRGTRSSIEMLKGYTDGESLGTPVLYLAVKGFHGLLNGGGGGL